MKFIKTVIILSLLIAAYNAANARVGGYWWGPRDLEERAKARLKKWEIGLSYMSLQPIMKEEILETITNPEDVTDVRKNQVRHDWNFTAKTMGIFVGIAHPLVKRHFRDGLRETYSALAFYTAPAVNIYTFDCDTFRKFYGIDEDEPHVFRSIQTGAYLGFDYKYGSDAVYKRISVVMYGIGAGVYPNLMLSYRPDFNIQNLLKPSVRPYIKGEIGFFAGIAIKLRATIMGSGLYYKELVETEVSYNSFRAERMATAPLEAQLSLVIMPFSGSWSKY